MKAEGEGRRAIAARAGVLVLLVACGSSSDAGAPGASGAPAAGPAPSATSSATPRAPAPSSDAGAPAAPAPDGSPCTDASGCISNVCKAGRCAAPSPADGRKNGTETDVDCGGSDPATPRCKAHATCAAPRDCASQLCGTKGRAAGRCLQAPSCDGGPGTFSCGLAGDEDCCTSLPVPGGSYLRQGHVENPATVSAFALDEYEITVGRLRAYFEAVGWSPKANPPAPGAGAHPKIPNSGWRATFDVRLPASAIEIHDRLGAAGCTVGGDNTDGGAATWTATPGPYEALPITCIDWYTLFAFCVWDRGRLPTDAEWGFAAEGGDEQRDYAWGKGGPLTWSPATKELVVTGLLDPVDGLTKQTWGTPLRTVDPVTGQVNDGPAHISPPGRTKGYARWGHADLTGNVLEFLLDVIPTPEGQCTDCANVNFPDPPQGDVGVYPPYWVVPEPSDPSVDEDFPDGMRSLRGGSWDPTHILYATFRYHYKVQKTYYAAGGRCAR